MISIGTDDVIDIRLEKYASNLAYGLDYSNPQRMKGRKIGHINLNYYTTISLRWIINWNILCEEFTL